jgi:hypothetical protein
MLNFLAFIIIDSKINSDDIDTTKMKTAGGMVVINLTTYLFMAGYGGNVIISSPKIDTLPYLQAAVSSLHGSQYIARVYFSIDMEFAWNAK